MQNMRVVHTEHGAVEVVQKQYYAKQVDGSYKLTDVPAEGLTPEQAADAYAVGTAAFTSRPLDGNGIPIRDNGARELQENLKLAYHQSAKSWNDPEFQKMLKEGRADADITSTSETAGTGPARDFNARYLALHELIQKTWNGERCLSLSAVLPKDYVHIWYGFPGNGYPYTSGHIASIEAMVRAEVNEKARYDMFIASLEEKQASLNRTTAEASRQYSHKAHGADQVEALEAKVARLEALLTARESTPATNSPGPAPELPGDPADYGLEPLPETSPVATYATPEDAAVAQKNALQSWLDKLRNGINP